MVYRTKRRVAKRARKTKRMYRSKSRRRVGGADKGYFEKISVSVPLRTEPDGSQVAQANIMWNAVNGVVSDGWTH